MRISDWSSDVCSSDLTVEARTVLDWSAVNGTGVSTAILPEAQNGLFDFTVSMGNGGPLLQQLQMLPAGDYVLEGHSIGIEQPARSRPYWIVRCQTGGEIGREIGSASCRERVCQYVNISVVAVSLKKKKERSYHRALTAKK